MPERANMTFYAILLTVAALSSFTLIGATDSKSGEQVSHEAAPPSDDSNSSQDGSKEKRSREEIMFGNQQNKPNGLVDDLMGMAEDMEDESPVSNPKASNKKLNTTQDEDKFEDALKDDDDKSDDKRLPHHVDEDEQNDGGMIMGSDGANVDGNWYNTQPVSTNALQYLVNTPTLQRLPSEDFTNSLYDQEDLYRRKRQLLGHPLPLRKRSLRSPLGQMIQSRGRRLPRRSMRLKRQVDVEDLLSLLGNLDTDRARYYDEQAQVPGRFNAMAYPEASSQEYRYPYNFLHRGELSDSADDNNMNEGLEDNMDDIDNLMLMPPNSRYVEGPELGIPYRSREDENEAIQKWLSRHTTPSVFSVSRRSSPVFYPIDYRYVPGYKKRSRLINTNSNRMGKHMGGEEDQESDFGKWGQIVQVPEAYASAEDVARLYALANLMSEGEDPEAKMRRSV